MKKPVQILLLFALLPMVGIAREETMEERKQRIVRKYLRERMTITQSDMVVPSDLPEDERVTDSEQFKNVGEELQRQEGSPQQVIAPPPPRPRPAQRADNNWLLGDMEETADANDPYADPFGDPYGSAKIDSGDDLWGDTRKSEPARRDPYRYNPYSREDSSRGVVDPRSQQQNSGFGSASSSRSSLFGQQNDTRQTYSSGLNVQGNQPRTYGSDPSEGLLVSPFPQLDNLSPQKTERDRNSQRYEPYKSPYQQKRDERTEQRGTIPKQEQPEFKRPDSYQQWKERNKTWDPTQDDAYINEMMQKNRP